MEPSIASLLNPTYGVAGVLVVVVIYLLRQNHADRRQYRADVAAGDDRHLREIKALHEQHATDLEAVRKELVRTREATEQALAELDTERRKRWEAEDAAAGYRRELQEIRGT